MDIKETILNVMREAGKPVSAGEVEKLSGLDRKDIDKAFKELKKKKLSFHQFVANGNLQLNKSILKSPSVLKTGGLQLSFIKILLISFIITFSPYI